MNHQNFFLTIFVGAYLALAMGCDDSGGGGATGGSTSTGTGGSTSTGGSTGTGDSVPLVADKGGFVAPDSNPLMIQGAWYAYADSIGDNGMPPGNCQKVGMHTDAECSKVIAPPPGQPFAPTDTTPDQKLCTEGTVEAVLMLAGAPDYSNMWGAGIGLDFNNPGMGAQKQSFNATAAGVKGISFEIDAPPTAGIRVEFPDAATNNKAAAYWKATPMYQASPVKPGPNTILWEEVTSPDPVNVPKLDPSTLMGIQFHVQSGAAGSYKFCISHVKFLK
jgi:hypothetical protein